MWAASASVDDPATVWDLQASDQVLSELIETLKTRHHPGAKAQVTWSARAIVVQVGRSVARSGRRSSWSCCFQEQARHSALPRASCTPCSIQPQLHTTPKGQYELSHSWLYDLQALCRGRTGQAIGAMSRQNRAGVAIGPSERFWCMLKRVDTMMH